MPWDLNGNSGIKPATNFLGTSDQRPLAIRTNGSERMRVTPDGNVGIGTTTTRAKLHVQGSEIHSGGDEAGYSFSNRETAAFVEVPSGGERWMWYASGGKARLWSGADKVSVGIEGAITNVIVGPGANGRLKIRHIDGKHWLNDSDDSLYLNWGTAQPVILGFGNNTQSSLYVSGNVGIGTMAPNSKLVVSGSSKAVSIDPADNNPNVAGALGFNRNTLDGRIFDAGFNAYQLSAYKAGLFFEVYDGTGRQVTPQALAISNNGNVGIGTKQPSERLEVAGNIRVTGDVLLSGADCAEDFDVSSAGEIEPGTVMVIDEAGVLRESSQAYDRRVAGVVSGGGEYRVSLILDKQESKADRMPVALMGKVYCKVDARCSPVEVGDLLTTASTPGHAMKADDPTKAFGAVLGKALRSLKGTQELVPVLVALQ